MRRTILIAALAAVAALAASACVAPSAATEAPPAAPAVHQHAASPPSAERDPNLAAQLAKARLATARYVTSLRTAKADGYGIITRMIPDMGYHFLDPTIAGFDVTRPHILVYQRHGRSWQLGALEWVFTEKPASPPLPGATYGSFGAACHYNPDGLYSGTNPLVRPFNRS